MHPEIALLAEVLALARIDAARGCPEALAWLRLIVDDYAPPPGSDAPSWVDAVCRAVAAGATIKDAAALARINSAVIYKLARRYPQLAEAIAINRARYASRRGLSLRDKPRRRTAA